MIISYKVCNERGQHQDDDDDAQRLSNAADVTVLHSGESKVTHKKKGDGGPTTDRGRSVQRQRVHVCVTQHVRGQSVRK